MKKTLNQAQKKNISKTETQLINISLNQSRSMCFKCIQKKKYILLFKNKYEKHRNIKKPSRT
jgi:hypothetical protein